MTPRRVPTAHRGSTPNSPHPGHRHGRNGIAHLMRTAGKAAAHAGDRPRRSRTRPPNRVKPIVLDLTRLGRDTRELLAIVEDDLHANGRHFRTLDGIVLDTSDDMCGELIFTVFAAIAKFQRQQILKGTREGLEAARARARVGGRPAH